MIFTADESVDKHIVDALWNLDITTLYIPENNPGIPDNEVLEIVNKNYSILITSDKDFGELVYLQKKLSNGIVLIRLHGLISRTKKHLSGSISTKMEILRTHY